MPADPEEVFELQQAGDGSTSRPSDRGESLETPNLLSLPEEEVGKECLRDWNASHRYVKPFMEQWRANVYRSKGYTGVQILKKQDDMAATIPAGARPDIAGMNKAARRKRQLRAALFADAAVPECVPATDADEDRDAAEFSTRVLQNACTSDPLDFNLLAGDTFDLGSDYGSGFLHFFIDPRAGGWRPAEIVGDAEFASHESEPWPLGERGRESQAATLYIREDGSLTQERNDRNLRMTWLPGLRYEKLSGRNFRFLPHTAGDLWEAEGAMIGALVPWGIVKSLFAKLQQFADQDRDAKILGFRPQHAKELPFGAKLDRKPERVDDQLVFVLTRYHKQSALYPRGARLVIVGDGVVAHRQEWWDEIHGEPLDIPVTQFGQLHADGNPYYEGVMQYLGPGNEARSQIIGTMFEHLDKFQNRKQYVPITAANYPWLQQGPAGMPIPILAPGVPTPVWEDLPDLPRITEKMFGYVNEEMDDEVNLSPAIRGLSQAGVSSGIDRQTVVEQALIMLSELRQRTLRGFVRGWQVILQLFRAYYTEPQVLKFEGEDGRYKKQHWTQADLGSTRDVRLMQGSFTQLAPSAKAAQAQALFQMQVISPFRLRELMAASVGGQVGLQQDPQLMRVRGQIAAWKEGPPEDWQPPKREVDPNTGEPAVDEQGQPLPPPPDPVLQTIFAATPADGNPEVALLREYELRRALASNRIWRFPEAWRQGLFAVYEQARQAAGIQTAQEQAQAQQSQAEAQSQQAEQQASAAQQAQAAKAEADQQRMGVDLWKAKIAAQARIEATRTEAAAKREGEMLDVVAAQQ